MDEFGETSTDTPGYCQMIDRRNLIHREWTGTKLYMEEIVFDFLCLEDDIIEDLCKDFPAQNNYQRYAVAHSYDFDRRKLSVFQSSEDSESTGKRQSHGTRLSHTIGCGSPVDGETSMSLSSVEEDRTQQFQTNPNTEVDQGSGGLAMNGDYRTTLDIKETENCDPIVLNYELLAVDGRENEAKEDRLNEKMKIKIELLEDVVVGDGLGSENNDQDEDTCDTQSRTAKIRLRIPKSIIDSEDDSLRTFIINRIKEKYNRAVNIPGSAENTGNSTDLTHV